MVTEQEVVDVIKTCFDPEIPVNIYDLGLIYNIQIEPEAVHVQMTLTSQGCPSAQQMPAMIQEKIQSVLNVPTVDVNVVWEPPWSTGRMSEEAKLELGI